MEKTSLIKLLGVASSSSSAGACYYGFLQNHKFWCNTMHDTAIFLLWEIRQSNCLLITKIIQQPLKMPKMLLHPLLCDLASPINMTAVLCFTNTAGLRSLASLIRLSRQQSQTQALWQSSGSHCVGRFIITPNWGHRGSSLSGSRPVLQQ